MRVEQFNPNKYDQLFENTSINRLVEAAEIIADKTRQVCPIGTITRPMYIRGKYKGQPWTSRDGGRLKKSIRVVRKKTKSGKAFSKKRNVRVYVGNYFAYYAKIVEYDKPFLRPSFYNSLPIIKTVIGAK